MSARLSPAAPAVESRFGTNTEGWTVVTYPGAPDQRATMWVAGTNGTAPSCRYSPAAGEDNWYFNAPAPFLGDRGTSFGGSISFVIGFAPPPADGAAQLATPGTHLVIKAGTTALGLDVVATRHFAADATANEYTVTAPLEAAAGWTDISTGAAATDAQMQSVLSALDGLLIKGDSASLAAYTQLLNVSLFTNPRLALQPSVTLFYEDQKLKAAWEAIDAAYAYHVAVQDAGGTQVFSTDVSAEDFVSPLTLSSETFTPAAGATYTARVNVLGLPSVPQSVAVVSLEQAVLSGAYAGGGMRLEWHTVTGATGYDLRIVRASDNFSVLQRQNIAGPPLTVGTADGLALDTQYQATLRARAGNSFGAWSNPFAFLLQSARSILLGLQERLNAARTASATTTGAYDYPFNETTLPSGAPGNPARILSLFTDNLGASLSVTSAVEPALSAAGDTLQLSGTASVLGITDANVSLVFTVSSSFELDVTLNVQPPAGWTFADTYPVLYGTPYHYLRTSQPAFVLTSFAHADASFFFPLQPGLQFQATLAVQSSLLSVTGDASQPDVQTRRFGGSLDVSADGRPQFAFTGESSFAPLNINRIGQTALTLADGALSLTSTRTSDVNANDNKLVITGNVAIGASTLRCELQVPTIVSSTLWLSAVNPAVSLAKMSDALTLTGASDVLSDRLPTTLLDLTGATMTAYQLAFDPAGNGPTLTTFGVGMPGASWPLVPSVNLSVGAPAFTATVQRAPSYASKPYESYSAEVSGQITLGGANYSVRAGVPLGGAWYVQITDTSGVPTLANLASLTNLNADAIAGVLPDSLRALGSFNLTDVLILVDPTAQSVTAVSFTINQTQPWPICGGLITVQNWSVILTVARSASDGWTPSGVLSGQITLAAGQNSSTFDVSMRVPIGNDALWTIALARGSVVHVPTVGQILGLFGNTSLTLPVGISSLGGLDITLLTVSFDPSAVQLEHVAFACRQASDWVIIQDQLKITNVASGFSLLAGTSPVKTYGYVKGAVTVAGVSVEVSLLKNSYEGDWLLEAAYSSAVHVPGFTALNAWLSPTSAEQYLPSTLPLSGGFDFSNLLLQFDGTSGALKKFGFEVSTPNLWTIVEGKLSITSVRARLSLPYPVTASGITGSIRGLLTLADVNILVTANKPTTGSAWEFGGSLAKRVTLDFVAAINTVAETANFALPADITSYGFPRSVTIMTANVRAVPDTGLFHFDGSASFDWQFNLGLARLAVRSVGGTIDVPQRGAALTAVIEGAFDFAGIHTVLGLQVGTQNVETVLTGTVAPADASNIQISEVTDGIAADSADDKWASVVPPDLATLLFANAALYLNLTRSRFLLYGELRYGQSGLQANAMIFCEPTPAQPGTGQAGSSTGQTWNYAVALSLGNQFRFGNLFSALSVIDDYLTVSDARAVVCDITNGTLGALSQETTTLLGAVAPQATSPLAGLSNESQALTRGVVFNAQLEFPTNTLFANILQIGSDATPPIVRLSAVIDRADSTKSLFSADLPDITVLSTILITKQPAYQGIHLTYSPGNRSQLQLAGRIQLTGIFSNAYSFDVTLTVDSDHMSAAAQQTSQAIVNPFGLPGITISGLAVAVDYTFAKPAVPASGNQPAQPAVAKSSQFTLQGHVLFGPEPQPGTTDQRLSFLSKLALNDGSPALMYIAIDRDFSIGGFLAQCITGNGADWPSSFIDVSFLDGTRIYYYSPTADPGGKLATFDGYTFREGYNVDALIRLTLINTLTIRGTVQVLNDAQGQYTGIRADIALLEPIDLVFIELAGSTLPSGAGAKYTGGPELGIQTGDADRFYLSTGLNFLSTPFLHVEVGVSKNASGQTQFDGDLQAAQPLEPFGVLRCSFTYTVRPGQSNLLRINNWPDFQWVRDLIDFAREMKKLCDTSDGSPCGTLANMIAQNAYSTSFSISPSVGAQGDNLVFSLAGSYSLTIVGASSPFLTLAFPSFDVNVPKQTTYNNLPGVLATGVTEAGGRFARDLLSRPDKVSLFLAMVFGQKAVAIALEFACNGIVDSVVPAATEAAVAAIASEAGGVLAAGAAAAAAVAIGTVIASSGGGSSSSSSSSSGPVQPQTPTLNSVVYAQDTTTGLWGIKGTWHAASYAAGYTFEVLRPDGTSLASNNFGLALTGSLPVDAASLAAGTYQGRVKSTRGALSSGWSTRNIGKPAAPALRLSYQDSALQAAWDDMQVDSYVVQFFDPQGNQIGGDQTVTAAPFSASIRLDEPAAGAYGAHARAVRNTQLPGDWGNKATLAVLTLDAPTGLALRYGDGNLTASWQGGGQAGLTYELLVTHGATTVARASTSSTSTELPPLTGSSYAAGNTYTVAIRAHGENAVSPWASATITLLSIAPPTGVVLSCQAGQLFAAWDAVAVTTDAGAVPVSYNVALFDAQDERVGGVDAVSSLSTALARSDGHAPAEGQRYRVRVQAVAANNLSAWSAPADLTVVTLPAPTGVVLGRSADSLVLDWNAVSLPQALQGQPLTYNVQLFDPSDLQHPLGEVTGVAGTSTPLTRRDNVPVAAGQTYVAKVQSIVPLYGSAWAESNQLFVLDAVSVTSASYQSDVVTVVWSASSLQNVGYEVQLTSPATADRTNAVTPPEQGAAPLTTTFDMTGQPKAQVYTVSVRVVSGTTKGSWSAPATVVVLDPPGGFTASYADNRLNASWQAVPGAQGYLIELHDLAGHAVARGTLTQENVANPPPPATAIVLDVSTVAKGVEYFAFVAASIPEGYSAWAGNLGVVLLDAPSSLTLAYSSASDQLAASWPRVPDANAYLVELLKPGGEPALQPPTRVEATSEATQGTGIGVGSLPEGSYQGHVCSAKGSLLSQWGGAVSFTIRRLTASQLAQQLRAAGDTAQTAAPKILAAFPSQLSNDALQMLNLLKANFPESTKTPTQLAWALAAAPYSAAAATAALSTSYQGTSTTMANIMAAIKAAYPAPSVQQQVAQLKAGNSTAQEAAPQIRTAHSDLTALQMGVLLIMNFAGTVQNPTQMAQALKNANYTAAEASAVLGEVFPLSSLASIAAALKTVYPRT